jgi:hypothetical protein
MYITARLNPTRSANGMICSLRKIAIFFIPPKAVNVVVIILFLFFVLCRNIPGCV